MAGNVIQIDRNPGNLETEPTARTRRQALQPHQGAGFRANGEPGRHIAATIWPARRSRPEWPDGTGGSAGTGGGAACRGP